MSEAMVLAGLLGFESEEIFHDVAKVGRLGDSAEGIVQLAVEDVELLIDRLVFRDWLVGDVL